MKYRFSEDIIERLLKSKWWELNDKVLKTHRLSNVYDSLEFIESIMDGPRTAQPYSIVKV